MLNTGVLFSGDFANNHPKALDLAPIYCSISNISDESSSLNHIEKRLFFNKEFLNMGLVFIRVGD
jgi:hypothetical protein